MRKTLPVLVLGIIVILIAGLVAILNQSVRNSGAEPPQRACTTEAMICPDGTAVGRTGPNCEFAPCPSMATTSVTTATSTTATTTATTSAEGM